MLDPFLSTLLMPIPKNSKYIDYTHYTQEYHGPLYTRAVPPPERKINSYSIISI